MAMGRRRPVQQPLFVRSDELAGAPRHRFYEKLNELLDGAGFDAFVEEQCAPFFAEDGKAGRISTRPGVYFRMLFIGYFEGIESERGICCARRIDRTREKKTSNEEWVSPTDADAEITRIKDGRTRLAYKAENTIDMETGAILAAEVLPATTPDGESVITSVEKANENVAASRDDDDNDGGASVVADAIEEVVGDKGFHKASTIKRLKDAGVRTYFPERKQKGERRWKKNGGRATAIAVYQNRKRLTSRKSKELQRRRGELLERGFAHLCETGGHRRTRLRGRENVRKRYLMQAAAFNLSLVMRKLIGHGTPRALAAAADRLFAIFAIGFSGVLVALTAIVRDHSDDHANRRVAAWLSLAPRLTHSSTGC